jgi:hypothetical protein
MGVQKHYKKRFAKQSRRKGLHKKIDQKKSTKKIQNRFFLICFNHVFGRFSVRGVQKHDKKIPKKSDQPWYFFSL